MTPIREAYLVAAASAADLLSDPAVAKLWDKPSALQSFSVSGLAGHLAAQVLYVPRILREDGPATEPVSLLDHYSRVLWIDADIDSEVNVRVRNGGEEAASVGASALADQVRAATAQLPGMLAVEPRDRVVSPPAGPWAMHLDDFLVTRLMEIAVHSDDLAYSVGVETPALPPSVLDPVFRLLTGLAERRHGSTALLRAFSRAERAPQAINAF